MRIQYVSDIHLELLEKVPYEKIGKAEGVDVLVLAGDIGDPECDRGLYRELLEWASREFGDTVVVIGNHECYGRTVDEAERAAKKAAESLENVHVLCREVWVHRGSGIRFAGATLWSNVDSRAFYRMNDRKQIRRLGREDVLAMHARDRAFFESILGLGEGVVCVSHHGPLMCMEGAYEGSELSSGFCTQLSGMFRRPLVAWICGHTHQSLCVDVGGIPCVSNCLGYAGEGGTGFKTGMFIDIGFDTSGCFRQGP